MTRIEALEAIFYGSMAVQAVIGVVLALVGLRTKQARYFGLAALLAALIATLAVLAFALRSLS